MPVVLTACRVQTCNGPVGAMQREMPMRLGLLERERGAPSFLLGLSEDARIKHQIKAPKAGQALRGARGVNLARSATPFRTIIARARSTSQREEAMNAKSQRERSRREFLAGAGACALAVA